MRTAMTKFMLLGTFLIMGASFVDLFVVLEDVWFALGCDRSKINALQSCKLKLKIYNSIVKEQWELQS